MHDFACEWRFLSASISFGSGSGFPMWARKEQPVAFLDVARRLAVPSVSDNQRHSLGSF